jgi:tetratricopeptide (TPR) repeat protein
VAKSLNILALLLWEQGEYEQARPLYERSLAIWEKALGKEHSLVATGLNNLATTWERSRDTTTAEPLFREALSIKRKMLGDVHPSVALGLNNLAGVLRENGQLDEAERSARESLRIFEAKAAPGEWKPLSVTDTLATVLVARKNYTEAERLLLDVHNRLKDRADCPPQIKREVLTHMVELYDAWNAVELGKGYAEKATEWRAKLEKQMGEH